MNRSLSFFISPILVGNNLHDSHFKQSYFNSILLTDCSLNATHLLLFAPRPKSNCTHWTMHDNDEVNCRQEWRGVSPKSKVAISGFTLGHLSSKYCSTSTWPHFAATCNGVNPFELIQNISINIIYKAYQAELTSWLTIIPIFFSHPVRDLSSQSKSPTLHAINMSLSLSIFPAKLLTLTKCC